VTGLAIVVFVPPSSMPSVVPGVMQVQSSTPATVHRQLAYVGVLVRRRRTLAAMAFETKKMFCMERDFNRTPPPPPLALLSPPPRARVSSPPTLDSSVSCSGVEVRAHAQFAPLSVRLDPGNLALLCGLHGVAPE